MDTNLMAENASSFIDSPIHLLMSHHKNQRALKHKRAQIELRERLLMQKSGANYLNLDEQNEISVGANELVEQQQQQLLQQQQKRASLGSSNKLVKLGGEDVVTREGTLQRSETVTTSLNPVPNGGGGLLASNNVVFENCISDANKAAENYLMGQLGIFLFIVII